MRKMSLLIAASALVGISGAAHARWSEAEIRGTVSDESGAAVAYAELSFVHVPTNTVMKATTDQKGRFSSSFLRSGGPYVVTIDAPGFQKGEIAYDNLLSATPLKVKYTLSR